MTIAFLTGYIAFLPAAALGVSGVLAVVTAGVYMGWHTPELTTVDTTPPGGRLLGDLQLPPERAPVRARRSAAPADPRPAARPVVAGAPRLRRAALGRSSLPIRFVYGFPIAYIPRWLSPSLRERDPTPPWQFIAFIAWAGMRGAVTLAAALAIPLTTDSGAAFPDRSLIVFLAFSIVARVASPAGALATRRRPLPGTRGRRRRRAGRGEGAHPRRRGRHRTARRAHGRGLGAGGHR